MLERQYEKMPPEPELRKPGVVPLLWSNRSTRILYYGWYCNDLYVRMLSLNYEAILLRLVFIASDSALNIDGRRDDDSDFHLNCS
jgi:hypothetical protein